MPKRAGGLLVGEADDVDGDEDVAEVAGQRGDRGVELAGLERGLRLSRAAGRPRGRDGRAAGRDAAGGLRRSESGTCCAAPAAGSRGRRRRAAGAGARARGVGLLDEVLGVLARTAQRPGGAIEPVEVVTEPRWVERAFHRRWGYDKAVRPREHRSREEARAIGVLGIDADTCARWQQPLNPRLSRPCATTREPISGGFRVMDAGGGVNRSGCCCRGRRRGCRCRGRR